MSGDVAVIGAGPAGCCSAIALRRLGRSVVLVECRPAEAPSPAAPDWISHEARRRLERLGAGEAALGSGAFRRAVFHSPDFSRTAVSVAAGPTGWRVDYGALTAELMRQAVRAGATLLAGCRAERIEAGEEGVRVIAAGETVVTARAAILAHGAGPLTAAGPEEWPRLAVRARLPLAPAAGEPGDAMHWVLGLPYEVMSWFEHVDSRGRACWVTLHTAGPRAGAERRMRMMLAEAARRGALPAVAPEKTELTTRPLPAAGALEAETHVGKLVLTAGEAGGFVSELTGEGIHPATWSGELAAEAVHRALSSPHVQDGLREFSTLWRRAMAGYLRPPGADPQFLLPLVFSNRQIADRLASACWHGRDL